MEDKVKEKDELKEEILKRFVTDTKSDIFVLRNLPEVIKGALFSRYSRSSLSLKQLLLKEFVEGEDAEFESIVGKLDEEEANNQIVAIQKAQNFYDRILDGYGDDSIGELGGAHLALENVSMLAAKEVEDRRIGGSPLEKSTRYVYFDQKTNEEWPFYRDPVLMASAFKTQYVDMCDSLFETYSALIPDVKALFEELYPREAHVAAGPYSSALRAKVCDAIRGLLPASTFTNMGVFGNGRFFESLLQRLHVSSLTEMRDIGTKAHEELSKVIPSFVRRADPLHRHQKTFADFVDKTTSGLKGVSSDYTKSLKEEKSQGVNLVDCDADGVKKVARALLFSQGSHSMDSLDGLVSAMSDEQIANLFEQAAKHRENRRHKSPRALEHANFTFEITADFGCYRDLQRHRMLSQERQLLDCKLGYWVPEELVGTKMEGVYRKALDRAKGVCENIAQQFPHEAQYVVPMAYNLRWYFTINLRALQWLCELRSGAAGHSTYRFIAQEMAAKVCEKFPAFKTFFAFVDYDGHNLGRLGQEIRTHDKKQAKV